MVLKAIALAPHPLVLIPEVGQEQTELYEKTIRGLKDCALEMAKMRPRTIVCITPHGNVFEDGFTVLYDPVLKGDLSAFGAPEVAMEKHCDMGLLDEMNRRFSDNDCYGLFINPKIAREYRLSLGLDPGVMVPLYYLDKVYPDYKIVHITIGGLSPYELYRTGRILREAIEVNHKDTVILACGNLSHCALLSGMGAEQSNGSEVMKFDQTLIENLETQNYYDLLFRPVERDVLMGACGIKPMIMALGATDSIHTQSEIFSYEKVGETGALAAMITFDLSGDDPTCESLLARYDRSAETAYVRQKEMAGPIRNLAIETMETWLNDHRPLNVEAYMEQLTASEEKEALMKPAACYVEIRKNGTLRGCMGGVTPMYETLAQEICRNTIEAMAFDPRFMPIEPEELHQCAVSVSVVQDIMEMESIDEINPFTDGLIVEWGLNRAILLPGDPEIRTAEEMLSAALEQAGIPETELVSEEKTVKVMRIEFNLYKS